MEQARITGRVRTSHGAPVGGAIVALGGSSPRHPDIALVTDDEGRYLFTSLTPGDYTVIATSGGSTQGSAEVQARPGETATADVWLQR
jgi:hypothetical protein